MELIKKLLGQHKLCKHNPNCKDSTLIRVPNRNFVAPDLACFNCKICGKIFIYKNINGIWIRKFFG